MTTKEVIQLSYENRICYKVHKSLGPELLESIYEKCLAYEFTSSITKSLKPFVNEYFKVLPE